MPPKPWLAKTGPPREDVSAIIQSNPTMKQQIPKISMQPQMTGPLTAQQTMNTANTSAISGTGVPGATGVAGTLGTGMGMGLGTGLGTTSAYGTGYGSLGGGYGSTGYGSSMYGGYGSSMYGGMGGYGSSYGGMGGYGSSYGMGGYGRMGMMGNDPNSPNYVMHTLMTLESFGFLIGSFCQIGRSMHQNIEGLHLFSQSFKNLFKKIYEFIKNSGIWLGQKTKNTLLALLNFLKTYVLFMKKDDDKQKMKSLRTVFNVALVIFVLTLYPQAKKLLSKVTLTNA